MRLQSKFSAASILECHFTDLLNIADGGNICNTYSFTKMRHYACNTEMFPLAGNSSLTSASRVLIKIRNTLSFSLELCKSSGVRLPPLPFNKALSIFTSCECKHMKSQVGSEAITQDVSSLLSCRTTCASHLETYLIEIYYTL